MAPAAAKNANTETPQREPWSSVSYASLART